MDWIKDFKLENLNNNEYNLIIYVEEFDTEFARILKKGNINKEELKYSIENFVKDRFPNIRINICKIMLGSILLAVVPINSSNVSAATETSINYSIYEVVKGDTLWIIANKFNKTIDEIKQFNNLISDTIYINQLIKIPTNTTTHVVKSGDTLYKIAVKYNITLSQLKSINNIADNLIYPGQVLKIVANEDIQNGFENSNENVTNTTTEEIPNAKETTITEETIIKETIVEEIAIEETIVEDTTTEETIVEDTTTEETIAEDTTTEETIVEQTIVEEIMIEETTTEVTTNEQDIILEDTTKENISNDNQTNTDNNIVIIEYKVVAGDSLWKIANLYKISINNIKELNDLTTDMILVGQILKIPVISTEEQPIEQINELNEETKPIITYLTHTVSSGDTIWSISIKYRIPMQELITENNLNSNTWLTIGQKLRIPVHNIPVKKTLGEQYGELLDWWSEAQYVFAINDIAQVIDFQTGKIINIKRTIGANHADCEPLTAIDTAVGLEIWGNYSWTTRAVLLMIQDRKIAGSMSFMPHDIEYIKDNNFNGHFDIHFLNSTRHSDNQVDINHQQKIQIAAGVLQM